MHFFLPLPISASSSLLRHWKDYAQMIFMYFVVLNIIRDKEQPKAVVIIMSLVVLFIAMRSFRAYSGGASYTGSRYEGIFWVEGLGANHFAAFIAYNWAIFLGLFLLEANKWRKILFLVTVLFSIHPLFFSYSRGAYVAALGVLVLYGILRKRSLLILVVIIMMAWKTLLPPSVVDRISMTYDESGELEYSASVRLKLWDYAMGLFEKNPVIGAGSGSFGLMIPEELSRYKDTHNYFVKTLSEQGIVGITLLLIILYRALRSGWRLLSIGMTPFYKGLGMGFLGCIIAMIITNIFGDRWSYFVLGGYFWIFWGLVDRSIIISQDMHSSEKVASA